jgi:PhnB protein
MPIQPYLFFNGRCQEAIQFYQQALGATLLMSMRYRDCPEGPPPNVPADVIMHASLRIGDAVILLSDGLCDGSAQFAGFSLSLSPADDATARRVFDALAEGGSVTMPLGKTFWASCFGMLKDRFGVGWMVNAEQPQAAA